MPLSSAATSASAGPWESPALAEEACVALRGSDKEVQHRGFCGRALCPQNLLISLGVSRTSSAGMGSGVRRACHALEQSPPPGPAVSL